MSSTTALVKSGYAAVALLILALLSGCTISSSDLNETWFACSRDRDCAIIKDPTEPGCILVPVGKRYARSFVEWLRRAHSSEIEQRSACGESTIRYAPLCDDNRCSSRLRRNRRG